MIIDCPTPHNPKYCLAFETRIQVIFSIVLYGAGHDQLSRLHLIFDKNLNILYCLKSSSCKYSCHSILLNFVAAAIKCQNHTSVIESDPRDHSIFVAYKFFHFHLHSSFHYCSFCLGCFISSS